MLQNKSLNDGYAYYELYRSLNYLFPEFLYVKFSLCSYISKTYKLIPGQTKMKKASHSSSAPKRDDFQAWLSGKGPTVHYGVGCDYCGVRFLPFHPAYCCFLLSCMEDGVKGFRGGLPECFSNLKFLFIWLLLKGDN